MHQGNFRTHLSAAQGDPREREARRVSIHDAMLVIRAEHKVCEKSAYAILVQASTVAKLSVGETAARVLAGSVQN